MTDLVMRKRQGHAGEMGLFVESEVFEDDFSHIKVGAEVQVKATTPRSLRQLKFAWALATKIAQACDWVETKEDAMDFMLIEAKHFRRIYDPLRKVAVLKPKPTNFGAMDGTEYTRLLKRIVHVAVTIMVPGMDDNALKAEIEAMIGPDIPASAPAPEKPPRAPRQRKAVSAEPQPQPQEPAGGTAGNDNSAAPQEGAEAGTTAAPRNEEEYIKACQAWLRKQTDRHASFDYFNGGTHRQIRMDLKVSTGTRKMLERQIGEFFDERDKNAKAPG